MRFLQTRDARSFAIWNKRKHPCRTMYKQPLEIDKRVSRFVLKRGQLDLLHDFCFTKFKQFKASVIFFFFYREYFCPPFCAASDKTSEFYYLRKRSFEWTNFVFLSFLFSTLFLFFFSRAISRRVPDCTLIRNLVISFKLVCVRVYINEKFSYLS